MHRPPSARNTPFRSVPSVANVLVTGGVSTDAKLNPSIAPDIVPVAFAFRNRPMNAA